MVLLLEGQSGYSVVLPYEVVVVTMDLVGDGAGVMLDGIDEFDEDPLEVPAAPAGALPPAEDDLSL